LKLAKLNLQAYYEHSDFSPVFSHNAANWIQ